MPPMAGGLAVLSFAVTFAVLRLLLTKFGRLALDRPNERSLHERPVPRTGGVALLAGVLTSLGFGAGAIWVPLVIALALALVSFADDVRGLPTVMRLVTHLAAAALLVRYVLNPMHPLEIAMLCIAVAWVTNLYNFMDGSDGLAGGMALIGFGTYAVAAGWSSNVALLAVDVALAAAALAFLTLNFPPARIFLGDVGSVPLGFLAGALGIVGWRDEVWPLWFPVLVFGPFIADATVTLLKRLARGEKVWQAHRDHYYQRFVRMGAGHRGAALGGYILMLVCACAALYGRTERPAIQAIAFGIAVLVLVAAGAWVDARWARYRRTRAVN